MAFSSPNIAAARALQSSVLPTPVGPKKMNEPMGFFGSLSPTLPRRIALETASTASSWPTMRRWSSSSIWRSLSLSSVESWVTGTPVQEDTISAMSAGVTSSWLLPAISCQFSFLSLISLSSLRSSSRRAAARSNSWAFTAESFSASTLFFLSSSSLRSDGAV